MISLTEFAQLLLGHDWFYQFSEDSRVYRAGQKEREWLGQISRQSPDHAVLYRLQFNLHRVR